MIAEKSEKIDEPGVRQGVRALPGTNDAMLRAKAMLAEEMQRRRN